MSLLRKLVTVLTRTLTRTSASAHGPSMSPRADVTDGYEAWLAESFPGVR